MLSIQQQFDDYGSHHRTAGNKFYHRLGIPMIMFSLIGLLARVVLYRGDGWQIDAALILIIGAEIYYLVLEWRLALGMLLITAVFYFASLSVPVWILVTLFVLGWIAQFVGHGFYEKRRPAFMRNLVHLLIGPLWILNDVVHAVPAEARRATERDEVKTVPGVPGDFRPPSSIPSRK